MNLLSYTKKIAEKINFYDEIVKNSLSDFSLSNPFAHPVNITVIWIDDDDDDTGTRHGI